MNTAVAIKFRLYCTQTRMGEIVKVTGSGPELGNWNPAHALTLHTSKEEFPIWRAGIFIDYERQPDPDTLEYKYIIVPYKSNQVDTEYAIGEQFIPYHPKPIQNQIYWENFEGNRNVSLSQMGEIQVQDVFNEKKLIKLEVHQEQLPHPFAGLGGNNLGRNTASRDSKNFHSGQPGYDLKFVIPEGIGRPQPGYETVSANDGDQNATQKQRNFEKMVYHNFLKNENQKTGQRAVLNDSYKPPVENKNTNFLVQNQMFQKVPKQENPQMSRSPTTIKERADGQTGDTVNGDPVKSINYQDNQKRPHSDFLLQKEAMAEVEKETRKFVKMVRIERANNEDHNNLQTPLNAMNAGRSGSLPYFLQDEDLEEGVKSPQQAHLDQFVPIYQQQVKSPPQQVNAQIQVQNNIFDQKTPQMGSPPLQINTNNPLFGTYNFSPIPPIQHIPQKIGNMYPVDSLKMSLSGHPLPNLKHHTSSLDTATPFFSSEVNRNIQKIQLKDNHENMADFDQISSDDEMDKKLMDPDIRLTKSDSLIVMSFKLPLCVIRQKDGSLTLKESRSFLYPTIFRLKEKGFMSFQWIGWPGIIPKDESEKEKINYLLQSQNCIPIWLKREEIEKYILFNEQFMRPLFHNFKGVNENDIDERNADMWHAYCDINQQFVQNLLQVKSDKDMVWIHDIYLLLTPLYLKKKMVKTNIGFFIHSPFPSSDIYKTFQYRVELLKSLLCCDIIGFHLFEYARNFVASCRKILQLTTTTKKGGYMGVEYNGRTVLLKVNHIGINQDDVYNMIRSQSFFNFKYLLSQQVQYKKYIISSVDRLHPISGIKAKLEGYQMFLKSYPPYRQNTCLIQYILPESFQEKEGNKESDKKPNKAINEVHSDNKVSRSNQLNWTSELHKHTLNQINKLRDEIHREFGFGSLIIREENISQEQRCSLWSFSHILLNTSLRDGLCIQPMEFVSVKYQQDKFEKASCIVSEFSGCAKALGGSFLVNPYNIDDIASKIYEAIDAEQVEKQQRMEQSYEFIKKHTTLKWAMKYLVDMKRCYDQGNCLYEQIGFGLNWQFIKYKSGFKEIEVNMLDDVYRSSKKRVIIIDQEGCIPMRTHNGRYEPSSDAIAALNQISSEPENIVFVVSSESKQLMHKWYSDRAPRLGLAAENGFFWRWTSKGMREDYWQKLIDHEDFQWIQQVRLIMQGYKNKTEGSRIEMKETSIIWNYANTDLEFGQMQGKELCSYLRNVFEHLPIEIIETKTYIQVVLREMKKDKFIKTLIEVESLRNGLTDEFKKEKIDFVLYVGDDGQTEPVFKYLNRVQTKIVSPDINVYTSTIGRRATQAKHFISEIGQIVQILEQLELNKNKDNSGRRRPSKLYSQANFNQLQGFQSLLGSDNQKDDFVKTKNAGIFMKHNKKGFNTLLKNNLVQKTQNQKSGKKYPVKNQTIKKKTMSLANLVDSSDDGEDQEMHHDVGSEDDGIGNMDEEDDIKMDKMMTSIKQPEQYQNYMGFLEEEENDYFE